MKQEDEANVTETKARAARRRRDHDDLNNEVAGREVGRIERFLPENASPAEIKKRKKRERERLSALMTLLQNAEYAALYNETFDKLREAEAATERALVKARDALDQARDELQTLMEQANTLPDGTKVFRDADGNVWSADGDLITGAVLDQITWRNDAPSYQDYLAGKKAVDQAQQDIDALRHFQVDVLGNARDRLTDQDNPPSMDDLRDIQNRFAEELPHQINLKPEPVSSVKAITHTATADLSIPPG